MNRVRTGSALVFMVILLLFGVSMAFARPPAHGHHQGKKGTEYCGMQHYNHFFMMVKRLNLTPDQKQELAGILQENREKAQGLMRDMVKAKKSLINAMMADEPNPGAVSTAFDDVTAVKKSIIDLKVHVLNRMRNDILNTEQKATLDKMKDEMFTKMDSMLEAHFAQMDSWIKRHSQ